jgi:hypothetical protein
MDDQQTVPSHYAILIGVNAYAERPLRGCVRDVQDIKKHLEEMPNPVHIQIFTATETSDASSCGPAEDPMLWPTYENVVSSLEKTICLGKLGDFVYVHYSGHGTRMEASSEFSNRSTGDLALNLLEGEKGNNIRYLRGLELAFFLKAMVDKGLMVTLVLDCCFSGSVLRLDESVRFLGYDAEIDKNYPSNPEKCLSRHIGRHLDRDGSMSPSWLVDPDGYTILAACGPHEIARELIFGDNQRHGALSYFLLRTITKLDGFGKRHQDIYRHLCAKFRESCSRQNPMFYGNKDLSFFMGLHSELSVSPVPVIREQDGCIRLQAGQAHGVCNGDRFALYPFYPHNGYASCVNRGPAITQVTKVRAFVSDMVTLDAAPTCVQTGWIAEALSHYSLRRFPIRVSNGVQSADQWMAVSKERSSLDIHNVDIRGYPFSFHIAVNARKECEILDEFERRIPNIPAMMYDQEGDTSQLLDMIEHLVMFKHVRDLFNKLSATSFHKSFSAQLIHASGDTFDAGYVVKASHNDTLELVVENKGDRSLYLHVYDLGPCWQVENIFRRAFEVIPPRATRQGFSGTTRKKLKMTVPTELREKGLYQCDDIIKVFITAQPTSFMSLELPKIERSTRKDTRRSTLMNGLRNITGQCRDGTDGSEEWTALSFPIHITLK